MKDYIEKVLRTESTDWDAIKERLNDITTIRLLHAAMGKVTEAGEFIDVMKKYIMYGKPIDTTNLKEEIGDGQWYDGIACDALGTDFDTEQRRNINKLESRYPEKFSFDKAVNRDLELERKVLES
jgi:NTP pyrophosphatase (non-canonical NTP hydrolase)